MYYDPIKQTLGLVFNRWLFTRRLFYRLLDILLLRTWHIHRELKGYFRHMQAKNNVHVLDAGSGFGQYSHYIARRNPGWKITGVDLKEEEIASCRRFFAKSKLTNVDFQLADLLHFRRESFYDLIISVDVMEHIENDRTVFRNFFDSLKPGGLLLVNTPSDKGGSGVTDKEDTSFISEHVRDGYGMEEIREKLLVAGFSAVEMKYTYGLPGSISWRISMKYPILLLGTSRLFLIILPLYYLFMMPFALILNFLDVRLNHSSGTGLLVKAWKPSKA